MTVGNFPSREPAVDRKNLQTTYTRRARITTQNMNRPRLSMPSEPLDNDGDADRYRAPALDKGLDILELLSEQKSGLTRAEITKMLGRNASEMYRMLERLVARQYVVRSPEGDRYSLSLKLYALAHRHPSASARPYRVIARTPVNCTTHVLDNPCYV